MRQKIVFFDIDGTLASMDDGLVPGSAVEAIQRMREKGHIAVIASGRPLAHIEHNITQIGFDGMVCSCGAHIVCRGTELFRSVQLPAESCAKIRDLAIECGLDVVYESEIGRHYDPTRPIPQGELHEKQRFESRGHKTFSDIFDPTFVFEKFVYWERPDSNPSRFREQTTHWFDFIDRENNMTEAVPHGCTKATGMQHIMDYFGVSRENTIAIGDGANDLPMFCYAGTSVLMGNGDLSLSNKVDFVAPELSNDGLKTALQQLNLLL